jgi:hypothetical protein
MPSSPPTVEVSADGARDQKIGRAVERAAVRFVRSWGFSTVEMVASRFRMTTKATIPRASLARQVLVALPDVEWLDPAREWFTLLERESPMRAAIEKLMSAFPVIARADLEQALGKRHSFGAAPPAVVSAYVDALLGGVSRRGAPRGRAALGPEELLVLRALERLGGHAAVALLRETTRGQLSPVALNRVLQTSPLFLHASRGAYRVAGSSAPPLSPPPVLGPAREWRAAL